MSNFATEKISAAHSSARTQIVEDTAELDDFVIQDVDGFNDLEQDSMWGESGINLNQLKRNSQTLEEQAKKTSKTSSSGKDKDVEEHAVVEAVTKTEESATRFNKKEPELEKKVLLLLRASISDSDSETDILQKVLETFSDYTLADEALDFLAETTKGELAVKVDKAKNILSSVFQREITAGKNITTHALSSAQDISSTPSRLRDMYRDISGNPQDPLTLCEDLSQKFSYDSLCKVIRFLLHSIGSDLKAKGPSIAKGELYKLFTDLRILQAVLGIYRFFSSRMNMINQQFALTDLNLPGTITFENLTKIFIKFLSERYLSADKIKTQMRPLGINEELEAKIIVLVQFRDAIRQIAPRLYRSPKHRDEVLNSLIETLEEFYEEEEEKDDR